jgi:hypothetical protein
MPEWSFDMHSAPRGSYDVLPAGKDGKGARKQFQREIIITASACGVVTLSYYMPDERRFSMYTAERPPIAWMTYAGPETVIGEDGKARKVVVLPKHPTKATSWFDDLLASRRRAA